MRLIDADWLKDLLLMHEQNARAIEASGRKTRFTYADGIRTGYADVGLCPTIEAEPRWIPVTERLPEENGHYLVTLHSYCKAFFGDGEDFDETRVRVMRYHNEWILPHRIPITESKAGEIGDEVLAWTPLPKPYCGARMEE